MNQPVGGFEPVVELIVNMSKFEQLHIGEFDDLQGVRAVAVGDQAGGPVEHDDIVGSIRERQAGGFADLARAERFGFQPHQARDPRGMGLQPAGRDGPELKDHIFLAEPTRVELDDRRPDAFEPGSEQPPGRLGGCGHVGQRAGQAEQGTLVEPDGKGRHQRDRAEVEQTQLGAGRGDRRDPSRQFEAFQRYRHAHRRWPVLHRFGRAPPARQRP